MGRVTRAKAAQVAEELHIDADAVLELPSESNAAAAEYGHENDATAATKALTPQKHNQSAEDRKPLEEVAPNDNGASEKGDAVDVQEAEVREVEGSELAKSTRGKKGKKGRGGKKGVNAVSEEEEVGGGADAEAEGAKMEDILQAEPVDPGVEAVIESEDKEFNNDSVEKMAEGMLSQQSHASHVRCTRLQGTAMDALQMSPKPKRLAVEESSTPAPMTQGQTPKTAESLDGTANGNIPDDFSSAQKPSEQPEVMRSASPPPTATPKTIDTLREETPAKRSTSNKENMEPEVTSPFSPGAGTPEPESRLNVSVIATPARAHAETVEAGAEQAKETGEMATPQDQITATDTLDDAAEKVDQEAAVPASQEKSKPATKVKPAPTVRTTKASQARMSLAQSAKADAEKGPALGRSSSVRQSAALGRSSSTSQSAAPQTSSHGRSSSVRQTVASNARSEPVAPSKHVPCGTAGAKEDSSADSNQKQPADLNPHSKPRPVTLSFPTPPPPPKSKKAPTTSTFRLPGEAVAAKLKAAREERMKKEETEKKPVPFKARPAPNMSGSVGSGGGLKKSASVIVRGTAGSRARESMAAAGKIGESSASASGRKRAKTALASSSMTNAAHASKRVSSIGKPPSTTAAATAKAPLAAAKSGLTVSKRSSVAPSANTENKARASSLNTTTVANAARAPSNGTVKGKEVFNRTALAKSTAEREKKEKEEAAKRARVAAAERGRALSREWAEKQKMRKMGKGVGDKGEVKGEVKGADAEQAEAGLSTASPAIPEVAEDSV